MGLALTERAALADTLAGLGPDAPTLCEGWVTRDLAAHMVLRERRPDAGLGIVIKPLAGRTERLQDELARGDYSVLVEKLRTPQQLSPLRVGKIDDAVNFVEYVVHHEDARRGTPGWKPRPADPARDEAIWGRLGLMRRMASRKSPVSLALVHSDGRRHGDDNALVTVTGEPVELLLFCFGRQQAADVKVTGAAADVTAIKQAELGF